MVTVHVCADCDRFHYSHIFIALIILKRGAGYARLADARKKDFVHWRGIERAGMAVICSDEPRRMSEKRPIRTEVATNRGAADALPAFES